MSDSRLEKFIYAICSMDVSDLPVPLSRIEKLWNCLITGETPDFEPLSRNEKYLMAMLDRYDISNLPAPMSRGEKLLYKIAVGETDLSDVPGYLSRYEELLKYLIENGGISGGDFEYVLHTLNQSLNTLYLTAEKPVKSAILKGQTLVNVNRSNYTTNTNITTDYGQAIEFYDADMLPNTTYTIIMYSDNPYECRFSQMYNDREYALSVVKVGTPFVFTTVENYQGLRSYLKGDELNIPQGTEIKILIIEGDYTNIDIPYFEGIQSVKMPVLTTTGKNLFDGKLEYGIISGSNGLPYNSNDYVRSQNFIPINCETITFTVINGECGLSFYYYDKDKNFISNKTKTKVSDDLSIPDGVAYFKFRTYPISDESITNNLNTQIQIEQGTQATPYEPYTSTTLSTPSDLELRKVGDVKDELNLLTGELTQRIGEVVLDGSEKWEADLFTVGTDQFLRFLLADVSNCKKNAEGLCDKEKVMQFDHANEDYVRPSSNRIWIYRKDLTTTVEDLKQQLQANPHTIQYELATESIKTVDLTVVDQDNQPTELGTFENVTHVSLEAENLIPEVEMEVATRISEELASASPLMDDISTKQEQLNTTIDEQSENVDATMIATTEIFEETL